MKLDKGWKKRFNRWILERGERYYKKGRVSDLKESENDSKTVFNAIVSGDRDYKIEVALRDNKVDSISCSCPHYKSGNNCKHIAATLFAIEDLPEIRAGFNSSDSLKSVSEADLDHIASEIIEGLDTEDLKSLALESIRLYPEFLDHVIDSYSNIINPHKKRRILKIIDKLIETVEQLEELEDLIDYNYEYLIEEDLDSRIETAQKQIQVYLDQYVSYLLEYALKRKLYKEIAEITNYFFKKIRDLDYHHNYLDIFETSLVPELDTILEGVWSQILESVSKEVRRDLIHSFLDLRSSTKQFSEFSYELAYSYLDPEEREGVIVRALIHDIDKMKEPQKTEAIEEQLRDFRLNFSDSSFRKFKKHFEDHFIFRIERIHEYLSSGEVQEAITLLKESKRADHNDPRLIRKYTYLLIELYKRLNMKKELRQELSFCYDNRYLKREHLEDLKDNLTQEEWDRIKKNAYTQLESQFSTEEKIEIYLEEEMISSLNKVVRELRWFKNFMPYEERLRFYFPELLKEILIKEANFEAYQNRVGDVEYFIKLLTALKNYPGGLDFVYELVDDVRKRTKNDPLLLMKLEAHGF